MSEEKSKKPRTGMMHLICNGRLGLGLQDNAEISYRLDEETLSYIDNNEEGYVFETYGTVFIESQPYDADYCSRVKKRLANKEKMKELNAEMKRKYYKP